MKREEIVSQLGGIKLVNIDLSSLTASDELKKLYEERKEFIDAVYEFLMDPTEEHRLHVIEEYWDEVQSGLGYMERATGITADEVMEHYDKHLKKIKDRPRLEELTVEEILMRKA